MSYAFRQSSLALTLPVLISALLVAPSPTFARAHYATGTACGVELWAKKTLSDHSAGRIGATPQATTISWLVGRPAPADADADVGRLAPVETTIWRVRAQLVGYRIEDDSDLHLVLRDPRTGNEMIGEIPASYCVSKNGALYATW